MRYNRFTLKIYRNDWGVHVSKQTKKKKSVGKIVGFSLIGVMILFILASMILVKFIYDRQFPRYDRHDETVTAALRYKDMADDYPRELVDFLSGDHRLQGYIYIQDDAPGLVVVAHGIGGGADSYLSQIKYFLDQGWQVFAYDATGSFDSEGKSTKGFPQSLVDLDAALTYIASQPTLTDKPLLLFGHSWGGYAVASIPHYDYEIAGIASVSAVSKPIDMIIEQGERMMGPFIYTQYPFIWGYQRILFGAMADYNAVDALNQSSVPALIVHGSEDEMFDYEGSALIARIDEITNPFVESLPITVSGQNGHNSLFRSSSANGYLEGLNDEYRELYDNYDQEIPYEIKQDFYAKIDRILAQDINLTLMNEIHRFYLDCLDR